jgi:hypothetical protein
MHNQLPWVCSPISPPPPYMAFRWNYGMVRSLDELLLADEYDNVVLDIAGQYDGHFSIAVGIDEQQAGLTRQAGSGFYIET